MTCPDNQADKTALKPQQAESEEKLRVSEVKYRTLFNVLPFGITLTDDTGNIVESNHEAELLLGLSKEEQARRKIDGEEWHLIRKDGSSCQVMNIQASGH